MNDDDLALAFELAADAAAISLSWSGGEVPVTWKPDNSPVSEGDLEVDRTLVDILAEERPDDGVLSEESPERIGRSGRRWIIDPIDGTRQFVAGEPGWGNHIALEVDGEIVLGLITRPEDELLWWAVRGEGAHRAPMDAPQDRSHRLQVSTVNEVSRAVVSGYGPTEADVAAVRATGATWQRRTATLIPDFLAGQVDALWLRGGKIWDYAPLAVLTREAGGDVRSPDGGRALDTGRLLCSSLGLLDPLSQALNGPSSR